MSGARVPMTDDMLDQQVRRALAREAERVARTQPRPEVALSSLALRLGSPAGSRRRRAVLLAMVALLLTAIVVAALVGAQLLQPRPVLQAGPLGLGFPCRVELDEGVDLEISPGGSGQPTTYFTNGLVTRVSVGTLGLTSADRPRGRAVSNSSVFEAQLTDDGRAHVRKLLADLGAAPGCYRVRLPSAAVLPGEGTLRARLPDGLIDVTWTGDSGPHSLGPTIPTVVAERLARVQELTWPDLWRERGTLPPGVLHVLPASERWLVHVVFTPTDYPPTAVLQFGTDPPVSASDGRYAGVVLPGGRTLDAFGAELTTGEHAIRHRCGELDRADAERLAGSLDAVELGVDAEADLFTPDLAWGVDVELLPARSMDTCSTLEAGVQASRAPGFAPPDRSVVGDLAGLDPCGLVPAALRGFVDEYGYGFPPEAALGAMARSCTLERRASMGVLSRWTVLWLYPWTLTDADAELLAGAVFGAAMTREVVGGRLVWLNDCGGAERTCAAAAATLREGRFLLLGLYDPAGTPAERSQRAEELLLQIG